MGEIKARAPMSTKAVQWEQAKDCERLQLQTLDEGERRRVKTQLDIPPSKEEPDYRNNAYLYNK